MNRSLILNGFMATGKSSVARLLGRHINVPVIDLDEVITRAANKPVAEIFKDEGEAAFRAREAAALQEHLSSTRVQIIAVGGGALLNPTLRHRALEVAKVVSLTCSVERLVERCLRDPSVRPLLAGADPITRMRELLALRGHVYAECHGSVDTTDMTPDAVAREVEAIWREERIAVPVGAQSYAALVGGDAKRVATLVSSMHPSRIAIVTDKTVEHLYSAEIASALRDKVAMEPLVFALEPGEEQKTLASVEALLIWMHASELDRSSVVVGLGGGVVTDIAGFASAIYMRGMRWVAVPTTTLGMVDAALGGKTGVDFAGVKNLVGTFHHPSALIVHPRYTSTESVRSYRSGLAEIVKSAVIRDTGFFSWLEAHADALAARDLTVLGEAIARSLQIKASVVSQDERDFGTRALLNFGHTFGHAIEEATGFSKFTHGEAVSLGMAAVVRAGIRAGWTPEEPGTRLLGLLTRLKLPTDLPADTHAEALRYLAQDKKRVGQKLRLVILKSVGHAEIHPVPVDEARTLFAAIGR